MFLVESPFLFSFSVSAYYATCFRPSPQVKLQSQLVHSTKSSTSRKYSQCPWNTRADPPRQIRPNLFWSLKINRGLLIHSICSIRFSNIRMNQTHRSALSEQIRGGACGSDWRRLNKKEKNSWPTKKSNEKKASGEGKKPVPQKNEKKPKELIVWWEKNQAHKNRTEKRQVEKGNTPGPQKRKKTNPTVEKKGKKPRQRETAHG